MSHEISCAKATASLASNQSSIMMVFLGGFQGNKMGSCAEVDHDATSG